MGWCVEGTWEKYRISLPPYIQECSNADPYPECSNANTTNHHRSRGQSQAKAIFLAEIWFCRTPDPHPHRCLVLHGHGKEGRSRGCHYVEISWTPRSSRINSTSTPWIHLKLHPLGRHHAWPWRGRRSRVPSLRERHAVGGWRASSWGTPRPTHQRRRRVGRRAQRAPWCGGGGERERGERGEMW